MILKNELAERIKKEILNFAELRVGHFLAVYPQKIYYAFAFDCNAKYGEINLCFNTEDDFKDTLADYCSGVYADSDLTPKALIDIKFNPGDWEYQSIDTLYPISQLELDKILNSLADDSIESWNKIQQEIMMIFEESLNLFKHTDTYKQIRKTDDFIAFCIDHNEEVLDALARQTEYNNTSN